MREELDSVLIKLTDREGARQDLTFHIKPSSQLNLSICTSAKNPNSPGFHNTYTPVGLEGTPTAEASIL